MSINIEFKPNKFRLEELENFNNHLKNIVDNSYITMNIAESEKDKTHIAINTRGVTKEGNFIFLGSTRKFDVDKKSFFGEDHSSASNKK